MRYTFMPSYFVLENIAENCARSFTGDCGVFALLFVTLCRCAGIPAQWQSGLAAEPGLELRRSVPETRRGENFTLAT